MHTGTSCTRRTRTQFLKALDDVYLALRGLPKETLVPAVKQVRRKES
jgi:hypothetical protein